MWNLTRFLSLSLGTSLCSSSSAVLYVFPSYNCSLIQHLYVIVDIDFRVSELELVGFFDENEWEESSLFGQYPRRLTMANCASCKSPFFLSPRSKVPVTQYPSWKSSLEIFVVNVIRKSGEGVFLNFPEITMAPLPLSAIFPLVDLRFVPETSTILHRDRFHQYVFNVQYVTGTGCAHPS